MHIISGGDSGGAKTHVFALLDALKKYAEVKMICLTPGVFYQEILKKDIDTELIEQKTRFDLSVIKRISNIAVKENFDVIHVHGARANFIATMLKIRIKIPVITTVHSDYNLDFTESLYKKFVFTGINRLALRTVDYYIGVSDNFKKMLVSRGFRPNKIFTVYNGMDYSKETPYISREEFASQYNIELSDELTYVGIIGRFDIVKGHEVFIKGAAEALKQNENLRFLLAGEGPEEENLKELCRKLKIEDKVFFLGFIKNIYNFINFIDINTLTSLSESFPYVLLEGAKLKKPTISSEVGGISDLIEDSVCGRLFKSGDYRNFANAICELVESPEKAAEMGEKLYVRATTTFSNDNLAKTHMDIYNAVLKDYADDKKYDVVLSGYYGFKNNGDDALLTAIMRNLKEVKKDIRIAVLSVRPKETRKDFLIDSINRFNPFGIIKVFKKSKLFLSGGGTLIHDATSSQSLYYYLATIQLAKMLKLKVMLYANGYGPIKKRNTKRAVSTTELADYITLRDNMSYDEMRSKGVKNPNVEITADPAITLMKSNDYVTDKVFRKEGISPDGKYIGISIRKWQSLDPEFESKIAAFADYMYDTYNTRTIFFPFKISEDYEISCQIAEKMKSKSYVVKNEYTSDVFMGMISRCVMLMGMRLHSLIYATTVSVPVIGLVYDPKIEGFLKYINQDVSENVSNIDEARLRKVADDIMNNKETLVKELEENTKRLKGLAMKNAEIAIELLERKI